MPPTAVRGAPARSLRMGPARCRALDQQKLVPAAAAQPSGTTAQLQGPGAGVGAGGAKGGEKKSEEARKEARGAAVRFLSAACPTVPLMRNACPPLGACISRMLTQPSFGVLWGVPS